MNLFFSAMTQRIAFLLWLKETNTFLNTTERIEHFEDDSKNWTFFFHDTKSWTSCQCDSKSWTFFPVSLKELNFFFQYDSRIDTFLSLERIEPSSFMTQRIEPIFFGDSIEHFSDPKNWTFFLNTTHRIEPLFFWNVTPRIEPDFQKIDSKNWIWLKDWTFFQYDPKNRTLCWMWLKVLNPLHKRTQIIGLFQEKLTQRIEPFWSFFWLQELKTFLRLGRWNFFSIWIKELSVSSTITQKWWTLFWTWLTETFLHFHSKNCFFFKNDAKFKEMNLLLTNESKTWTFFQKYVCKNLTFLKNTRRIDYLKKYQWKNKETFWKIKKLFDDSKKLNFF